MSKAGAFNKGGIWERLFHLHRKTESVSYLLAMMFIGTWGWLLVNQHSVPDELNFFAVLSILWVMGRAWTCPSCGTLNGGDVPCWYCKCDKPS